MGTSLEFMNRIVIVTGAGRGIGRSVASLFAASGATVALFEQNHEWLQSTHDSMKSQGWTVSPHLVDVRTPSQIEAAVRDVSLRYGKIDVLINNAGVSPMKSLFDITIEEWDDVVNTNLRGTFVCAREVARVMRMNGGGSIINIASTRALMSEPNGEAYAATKGGIVALTHALAASLGSYDIRVNCISPGWIETGDYGVLRVIDHSQHLAGRVGKPDDIARACMFLSSPENSFITGENLVVDGGMSKKMIYEP